MRTRSMKIERSTTPTATRLLVSEARIVTRSRFEVGYSKGSQICSHNNENKDLNSSSHQTPIRSNHDLIPNQEPQTQRKQSDLIFGVVYATNVQKERDQDRGIKEEKQREIQTDGSM
ncbi:hypothetical protein L2E82_11666 [Cichorium intybus]|uniref:Uncharacterized protein n=1 Tax=Cichorium intybus TaxID=13427 RepID=A0ACB9GF63_CICIN|nr:hypothetical protein L2E82_11666 [Cichorium intybus]